MAEKPLPDDTLVRFLYQPGEIEGGQCRRATGAIWSLKVYRLGHSVTKPDEPVLYYFTSPCGAFRYRVTTINRTLEARCEYRPGELGACHNTQTTRAWFGYRWS